jgi:hypothetical protein
MERHGSKIYPWRIAAAIGAVLALAACGGRSPSTTASTPAAPSPAPSSSAAASVDAGTAGRVCAALNALTHTGDTGSDAIATAEGAYHLTRAQVIQAIDERCPALKQIVPTGG